jgi:hypothetical protein
MYVYLDTNIFSLLSEDIELQEKFISWTRNINAKIIISVSTIGELFKKESKFNLFNSFINEARLNFMFIGAYSRLRNLEISNYPNSINLDLISLNTIISKISNGRLFNFFELKKSKKLTESINKLDLISELWFKETIDKWKQLYPPDKDVNTFSDKKKFEIKKMIYNNVLNKISKKLNVDNIDISKFKTNMIINEALFKKYLLNPTRKFDSNDFVDLMHISFSPYVDYFITEKNNSTILKEINKQTSFLEKTHILSYSEIKFFLA